MDIEYISKKGYEKLYEEYSNLDKEILAVQKEMGESSARDNDLRENPEFLELRVKAMYNLPKKKEELFERYKKAQIIEETDEYKNFDGTTVILGSQVELLFDGEIEFYKILGKYDGNIEEQILSYEAPIAKAILGKKVNSEVQFNGIKIKILSVKRI